MTVKKILTAFVCAPGSAPVPGYARLRLSEGKLQIILDDGTVKTVVTQ